MKILIVGDTHGLMDHLLALIEREKPDLVLQAGDFGFWPWIELPAFPVPVHWCDGNHEDHGRLSALRGDGPPRAHEVSPNCFWQDRGSTITLPDGRVVLFVGGADSIDKGLRQEGRDWFPGEILEEAVLARLPARADIVVSHTAPLCFHLSLFGPMLGPMDKNRDTSRLVLNKVFDRCRPSLWFFGHWHIFRTGEHDGCRWTMLNMLLTPELDVPPDHGSWWRWL